VICYHRRFTAKGDHMSWKRSAVVAALLSFLAVAPIAAQRAESPPGRAVVSLYRIAPGKHLEFLRWIAAREAVQKEAGAPAQQVYAHIDGDSWDFMIVSPELEAGAQAELDRKIEAAARKKGLATGPKQAIEIRQFVAWHTDTMVAGPMTAAQVLDSVSR
jgi:hypothetical protein